VQANRDETCEWLVVDGDAAPSLVEYVTTTHWQLKATIRRPSDKNEDWLIYRRKANAQN
jgi:hypothetical protein